MSRAYKISVKESVTRQVKAGDEISTRLELLEILAPEAMALILRKELEQRGFKESDDGILTRQDGNITITVDPCSGEVSVKAEASEEVTVEGKREAQVWDDFGPKKEVVKSRASEELIKDLHKRLERESDRVQTRATQELEQHLHDLQPELADVVNKVTRQALKEKAAELGTITEINEDDTTGSMIITVDV